MEMTATSNITSPSFTGSFSCSHDPTQYILTPAPLRFSRLRAELTEKLKSFSESLDESADDEGVKSSKSSKSMSKSQRGVVEAAAAAEAEAVRIGHRVAFARKQVYTRITFARKQFYTHPEQHHYHE